MENRGASASFLVCKIGVALAAVALISATFSMYASSARFTEEQDLKLIVNTMAHAIEEIDGFPCEAEVRREIPTNSERLEILVEGEQVDGVQIIHIRATATANVERWLAISTSVNGGDFRISMENPSEIIVKKSSAIQLELV